MKYDANIEVKLGDIVRLNNDETGRVVGVISEGLFNRKFKSAEWAYLKEGILVDSEKYGLFHFVSLHDQVEFLARSNE